MLADETLLEFSLAVLRRPQPSNGFRIGFIAIAQP